MGTGRARKLGGHRDDDEERVSGVAGWFANRLVRASAGPAGCAEVCTDTRSISPGCAVILARTLDRSHAQALAAAESRPARNLHRLPNRRVTGKFGALDADGNEKLSPSARRRRH